MYFCCVNRLCLLVVFLLSSLTCLPRQWNCQHMHDSIIQEAAVPVWHRPKRKVDDSVTMLPMETQSSLDGTLKGRQFSWALLCSKSGIYFNDWMVCVATILRNFATRQKVISCEIGVQWVIRLTCVHLIFLQSSMLKLKAGHKWRRTDFFFFT